MIENVQYRKTAITIILFSDMNILGNQADDTLLQIGKGPKKKKKNVNFFRKGGGATPKFTILRF